MTNDEKHSALASWLTLLLGLLVYAAYQAPTLSYQWVGMDDIDLVLNNPWLQHHQLAELIGSIQLAHFHPATNLWLWAWYHLAGMAGIKLSALLLHAINLALAGRLLLSSGRSLKLILISLMLWTVHPLTAEVLYWIPGIKESLGCMGALLALNFWRKNSILFCAGLLLAMLAKSSWVLLPWALLLWSWPNPPPASDRRRERACLMIAVLLSLGVAAMTYLGHKTFEARATFEEALRAWQNTSLASGERHSLSQVLSALSFYAGRWLIPVGMAPFFDLDQIQFVFTDGLGALAFLLLIALLWRGKNSRTVLWWCLASLMVLLPVSGVVPFGFKQAYAARYLYFPLPFMLFFLLDGLATLTPPSGQRILVAFSAVAIVLLAVTTAHYRESYRDAGHFHQAIVERFPQSAIGHNGLGKWYASAGQKDMALQHFTQAVAANPNYLQANYNLGVFYLQQDNCAQAMPWLSKALTLNPNLDAAKKAHAHCQAKVKIDPDANSR